MRLTRQMVSDIKKAARRFTGVGGHIELGTRNQPGGHGTATANGLLWADGADLFDFDNLAGVRSTVVADDPRLPGCATLDVYCYDREELVTNLYVTIKDGKVVDAHDIDRKADERARAILGVEWPYGKPAVFNATGGAQ